MLKLIKCEFWKLKRKRLLYALMSLSLFFPLILAYMAKAGTGADTTEHYLQTRFDYVYTEQFQLQIHNSLWQKFLCSLFSALHFV